MGLKDKLDAAKRRMWSPMDIAMLDKGSDPLVYAGRPAKVVVEITGEDDGTMQSVEIGLERWGGGNVVKIPLTQIPPTVGRHEVMVEVPAPLIPSCGGFTSYRFTGRIARSKGSESSALSKLEVVARPEDLYWPAERSGQEGGTDPQITITLDQPVIDIGTGVSGRVSVTASSDQKGSVEVELGMLVDALVRVAGKNQPQPRTRWSTHSVVELGPAPSVSAGRVDLPFQIPSPEQVPPTFFDGDQTGVVWQVRATVGTAMAWTVVGVLDPGGKAVKDDERAQSIFDLLIGY